MLNRTKQIVHNGSIKTLIMGKYYENLETLIGLINKLENELNNQ